MFDPNNPCLFCNSKQSGLAAENEFAYASYDTYPVSEFHCLIIPKRHVRDYFDLNDNEVIVNGQIVESGLSGIVKVEFTGDLAKLDCTNCTINGNVKNVDAVNVNCNDIQKCIITC